MLSMYRCRSRSIVVCSARPATGASEAALASLRTRPPRAFTSM
jgi:hypothetical protein